MKPDPTVNELLDLGRDIWRDHPPMDLSTATHVLTVVVGDLARETRAMHDGVGQVRRAAVERELGNLVLTALRAADDLSLDVVDCLAAAEQAQRDYATQRIRAEQQADTDS